MVGRWLPLSQDTWEHPEARSRPLGRDERLGASARVMHVPGSRCALAGPALFLRRTIAWGTQWGQLDNLPSEDGLVPRTDGWLGVLFADAPTS